MNEINYTINNDPRNSQGLEPASTRDLVGDTLEELEARGVRWSKILSTLAEVAQLRGQHELARVLATATQEVFRLEPKDEL